MPRSTTNTWDFNANSSTLRSHRASGAVSGPPDASTHSISAARDADEDWGDFEGDAVSAAIDMAPRDAQVRI